MPTDRLILHTVHDDNGSTELYYGRRDDDGLDFLEGGHDGSLLFHEDGSITFKAWTDREIPFVVTIHRNRIVVTRGEDQLSMTAIDNNERDALMGVEFDSDDLQDE